MNKKRAIVLLTTVLALLGRWAVWAQPQSMRPADLQTNLLGTPQMNAAGRSDGAPLRILSLTRTTISPQLAKYAMVVKVGPNAADRIGVYRVTRETAPWRPVRSSKAVFMLPGDASSFTTLFLGSTISTHVAADQSLGVYLAAQGVDVWGMDYRWAFVPDTTEDLAFMKDWNTGLHLGDVRMAVHLARVMRLSTGSGNGRLLLLGMSRGAQFAYALANEETQLPPGRRDLKGLIPMDFALKLDPDQAELTAAAYGRYQADVELKASGVYVKADGATVKYITFLATTAPNDPSSLVPGLSNLEAAWLTVGATYATYPPPLQPETPFFHNLAAVFDEMGVPVGLQFTSSPFVMDVASAFPSYQSLGEITDGEALACDAVDLPFDDHLGEITIPVFYVGAAGGIGSSGLHTLSLLGSHDIQSQIVGLFPPEAAALDYGHADLLWADNAKALVWQPLLAWIRRH